MQWFEITYSVKNGKDSWIYFKCKPERAKIEGEKKYKSFTYGWVVKTKLKSIKPIRQINDHEFIIKGPPRTAAAKPKPKRTSKRSTNKRAVNPATTKTSNRTTKAKSTNTRKSKPDKPTARKTRSKSVPKPKPTKPSATKRVSKRKPAASKQPVSRTTRRATGVSNTTRSNPKSSGHTNTRKRKNPGKSSRTTN